MIEIDFKFKNKGRCLSLANAMPKYIMMDNLKKNDRFVVGISHFENLNEFFLKKVLITLFLNYLSSFSDKKYFKVLWHTVARGII